MTIHMKAIKQYFTLSVTLKLHLAVMNTTPQQFSVIVSKSMESDYRPLEQNVSEQLEDINRLLIQSLGK